MDMNIVNKGGSKGKNFHIIVEAYEIIQLTNYSRVNLKHTC